MATLANARNIRQAQQALEKSEARRQGLLDSALDCIICTDGAARITDFNAAAERTLRIPRSAALGKDLAETILSPAARDLNRYGLFASRASAGIDVMGNRIETMVMRSDGTEFPAELTVTRVVIRRQTAFTIYVRDITARKRAEEAVVWLAAIVESSQDAVIGKDLNGRITSWNKGAESMYGYTAEEAIGQNVSLLVPPGRSDEGPGILAELRAGRRIENFETARMTKDGNLVAVSLTVSPVLNPSGTVIGGSAIARDITARKIAEESLRKANETSVYASPVPIIAADARGRVTMWNLAAEKLFGWSEKEAIGKPIPVIPEDEADAAAALHRRLMSGETITGVEVRRRTRGGSSVAISLSATPLWGARYAVKGMIGFLTDITERKRAEEALRAAEGKYRGIFENALDGIYQSTPDGKYISANPALVCMLGFDSPEELITRADIKNQYVLPKLHSEFRRLIRENGAVQHFEYQAYRKDGKAIWVSENAHVVRDSQGRILYLEGTMQDITQHRGLMQQLQHMQKVEAIGRIAGGVAHDFNNILMAIGGYAALLCEELSEKGAGRRYCNEIAESVRHGATLTKALLAFRRKQALAPRVLDMNTLIVEQINMFERLIPKNVELTFVPGRALGRMRMDPGQAQQILMNLVINARDAMLNGGRLLIETNNATLDQVDCSPQNAATAGNYVVLAVSDNGCGMDAETKSHIFEPFFTTKEPGKGTGLGLAILFGIVKENGGFVSVQSEPGQGTTFKILLPRVEDRLQLEDSGTCGALFSGNETNTSCGGRGSSSPV